MVSIKNSANKPKSPGRHPVDSEAVNVRFLREMITRLDDWRRAQDDLPNRPEAVRRLVEMALKRKPGKQ